MSHVPEAWGSSPTRGLRFTWPPSFGVALLQRGLAAHMFQLCERQSMSAQRRLAGRHMSVLRWLYYHMCSQKGKAHACFNVCGCALRRGTTHVLQHAWLHSQRGSQANALICLQLFVEDGPGSKFSDTRGLPHAFYFLKQWPRRNLNRDSPRVYLENEHFLLEEKP
jgi:hypothetical protein